jgi:hypothetical protein
MQLPESMLIDLADVAAGLASEALRRALDATTTVDRRAALAAAAEHTRQTAGFLSDAQAWACRDNLRLVRTFA